MGPVQILIVGFDDPHFDGSILEELRRLRDSEIVRLVDVLVVRKDDEGHVERYGPAELPGSGIEHPGAVLSALIGLAAAPDDPPNPASLLGAAPPPDADIWYVDDAIPTGCVVAIALIEHRWAVGLRDALGAAGGFHLADAWVHPVDLAAVGAR
jgi:hypothetical protein